VTRNDGNLLGGGWVEVLDRLGEAVIVLDDQRTLIHANIVARRLLGYGKGQSLGGRCRLTTRGVDCENACPLTFALEAGLDRVEDFGTVYHTADGREVSLDVTVVPLRAEDGDFLGAVEILRPTEPRPGFFMAGSSAASEALRTRVEILAQDRADVLIVGEAPACRDTARAIHSYSGMPEELFHRWSGCWDDVNPWPPGTAYAFGDHAGSLLRAQRPEGWRVVVGAPGADGIEAPLALLELPRLEDLTDDLPRIVGAWIEDLAPGKKVSADALDRLTRMALDRGLADLEGVLTAAIACAGDRIEQGDLPVDGYQTALVDELLRAPSPMAALEERLIREVLERCGWRVQETADRLGISRVTLWRKMKDLGIGKNS
jgi:transcriptional regulator of acetoin/glycerol metabolism